MSEQWTLSIEEKVLLAEKVMGYLPLSEKTADETLIPFWRKTKNNVMIGRWDGTNWRKWRPETNTTNAAELLMMLIQRAGRKNTNIEWRNSYHETICRLALVYAKGITND